LCKSSPVFSRNQPFANKLGCESHPPHRNYFLYFLKYTRIPIPITVIVAIEATAKVVGNGSGEGVGDCEGDGVGVGVGPMLGVGVDVGVGVGVGEGVGYVVVADHPPYPWGVHKARARTEYVLVFGPRLYCTVKIVVI